MANTNFKLDIKETVNGLRSRAAKLNKNVLSVSETVVEESIAMGEEWQEVMAKAMKNGTTLFGKQQELMLDTLELVKDQVITSRKRIMKLLDLKPATTRRKPSNSERAVTRATTKAVTKPTTKAVAKNAEKPVAKATKSRKSSSGVARKRTSSKSAAKRK